jgi:RNA polymerase sigma-70 factor (ECF subfamily)
MDEPGQITALLSEAGRGNQAAMDELLPLIYDELHSIAARYFRRERRDHTLQPTALVNEAYLRLVGQQGVTWHSRLHFLGIAAMLMRRILVDHARAHEAVKRGDQRVRTPLDDAMLICEQRSAEMLAIDRALTNLVALDPQQARLVELRFFGGLSVDEIAESLQISSATVKRRWSSARAWLFVEITKGHSHDSRAVGQS